MKPKTKHLCFLFRRGLYSVLAGLTLLLALLGTPAAPASQTLPLRVEFARDGLRVIAAVLVDIPPGYHAYAHEPGDSGRPAQLRFTTEEASPRTVYYSPGTMQRDYYDANATVFVYEGETPFFVSLPADKNGAPYSLELSLLLCSPKNCVPVKQTHAGQVAGAPPGIETMPWLGLWRQTKSLSMPDDENVEDAPEKSASGATPSRADDPARFQPRYADASLEITGLLPALLVGILAGLLLNAMPCVLPVLVLKVSGFLMVAGHNDKKDLKRLREHNLYFTAGVLTFFTALALILGLANLMWGQLYQNQSVLLILLVIVFLLALSMLGIFTLPVIDFKFASRAKKPRLQFYLTGLLSTFLATPCSGPLLGGVLGWAFTQNLPVLIIVFWSVGLGMSLPYLLLCVWPDMTRYLPKPGPWMLSFERVIGFLLLGTCLYLLSILPADKYLQTLCVLLLVAFCAWLWGRYCSGEVSLKRRLAGVFCCLLLGAATFIIIQPISPLPQWRAFNAEYFSSQLGKKNILVEFTADWCPNCKFLEATVLTEERLRKWRWRYDMEFIRVDLTSDNARASGLLSELGSKSIPLTALFPAGENASSPLVLRDVYSVRLLEKNMNKTFLKID